MPKKKVTSLSTEAKPGNESKLRYEDFLRSVKLYSLWMEECASKLDREKYWKYFPDDQGLTREISALYKTVEVEDDHFNVVAEYELTVKSSKEKKNLLEIKCTFSAHFHASADCNSVMADRFANSEAKIILWPYFRSLVADLVGKLQVPPITIPLVLD